MRILWIVPATLALIALFACLAAKKKEATSAKPGAQRASAVLKKLSLKGAIGTLVALLLAWWLGSSIYLKATGKTTKAPQVPQSEVFELKAGGDYIHTGIFFKAGDRIQYSQSEPKLFWIKNQTLDNLEVYKTMFVTRAHNEGEVQLIPGPEDTRVRVTVRKK